MAHYVYRSARTGKFVTRKAAERHPRTTLRETIGTGPVTKAKPRKKR